MTGDLKIPRTYGEGWSEERFFTLDEMNDHITWRESIDLRIPFAIAGLFIYCGFSIMLLTLLSLKMITDFGRLMNRYLTKQYSADLATMLPTYSPSSYDGLETTSGAMLRIMKNNIHAKNCPGTTPFNNSI